jgi:hypothetical protein
MVKNIIRNPPPRNLSTHTRKFSNYVDLRFTGFIQAGSATQPVNVISDLEGGSLGLRLTDFQNFNNLANIYDQVKVDNVSLKITLPGVVGQELAQPRTCEILSAYDPDGGTESTRDIYDRHNLRNTTLSFSNPSMTLQGTPGALSSDGRVEKALYYDTSSASIATKRFFFTQLALVTGGMPDPSGARLNLIGTITLTCTFKGAR